MEKFLSLFNDVEVSQSGDGYLSIDQTSYGLDSGQLFRAVDEPERKVAFAEDELGGITHLFIGSGAFEPVSVFGTSRFAKLFVPTAAAVLLLGTLIYLYILLAAGGPMLFLLIGFGFNLLVGAIFSTAGGLIGGVAFKVEPQAAAPAAPTPPATPPPPVAPPTDPES